MEPWFDTHVHLDRYAEPERNALLARAAEAEVALISVAVDLESSSAVLALMGSSPVISGAIVGIHPRNAAQWDEREARVEFHHPFVVGIGECGFDASGPAWEVQARAFGAQCRLARRLGKALVLHVDGDGAWEHLLDCASELEGLRVVRHYFNGDAGQAAWHRERGHYLSFGNPLRREPALRDIARDYPEGTAAHRNRQLSDAGPQHRACARRQGGRDSRPRPRLDIRSSPHPACHQYAHGLRPVARLVANSLPSIPYSSQGFSTP